MILKCVRGLNFMDQHPGCCLSPETGKRCVTYHGNEKKVKKLRLKRVE